MKTTNILLTLGIIAGFVLSGCVTTGKYKSLQTQATDLEGQLAAANDELSLFKTDLENKNKEIERLENNNNDLSTALSEKKGELSKRVADLNSEKQDLEKRVADLEKSRDELARAQQAKLDQMKKDYDKLVQGLEKDLKEGQIMITQLEGKLTVNVADKIFFDSGKATLNTNGRDVLGRLGNVIKKLKDKQVVVEGHTDNQPIGKSLQEKFPTNWELSTARATEVVRFLEEKGGIEPSRLIAVGYGSSRPIVENEDAQSRAKNRRIEIVFQDRDWKKVAPLQTDS